MESAQERMFERVRWRRDSEGIERDESERGGEV